MPSSRSRKIPRRRRRQPSPSRSAHGSLASGDPKIWKVVDGKLYLNLNQSVQKSWEKDMPGLIKRGDANWPKVLK